MGKIGRYSKLQLLTRINLIWWKYPCRCIATRWHFFFIVLHHTFNGYLWLWQFTRSTNNRYSILYEFFHIQIIRYLMWLKLMQLYLLKQQLLYNATCYRANVWVKAALIERFVGPTWGPYGADRTQAGPMLAPWTLLSGCCVCVFKKLNTFSWSLICGT